MLAAALAACAPAVQPASPGPIVPPAGAVATELPDDMTVASGTFDGCPEEGNALPTGVRALNLLKNRSAEPGAGDVDSDVTLAGMLAPDTNDSRRFDPARAANITGFVYRVQAGGIETTNCGAKDPAHRDTHIEMIVSPDDSVPIRRVIVEVTPRWRVAAAARGVDWSTSALAQSLVGRRVLIRGWLMFDSEHKAESENTHPGGTHNWRATAWEVHPVTNLGVVPGTSPP